ncbi:M6 family metalloprotease domain-containing protein [Thalassoglobus polymorphus]|uniref:Immune inhibitor A n=1 Tax=Thalassoglobus polymorphus TaxID=2527994 RepID=A0A517QHT9_9PLAN|nr:M6 family metalloprotease domain-containing protein [Thalassoglobus polymorphus]QDT31117.1 Immune inhibitor A precursor [Thalassoglobus polymorphus]
MFLRSFKLYILFTILICTSRAGFSAPASEAFRPHKQPDKTEILLRLRGDEWFNWLETKSGHTVVHREDGAYVYAADAVDGKLIESKLLVGQSDPKDANIKPGILPNFEEISRIKKNPDDGRMMIPKKIGSFQNLVVLARFSDHHNRQLPTQQAMDHIFNAVGGDPQHAPTGSVRDVYSENSYGMSEPVSTVSTWADLPKPELYYSEGLWGRGPKNLVLEAVRDSLNLVDHQIDFSKLDSNGDNFADCVTFTHSGYGSEANGIDPTGAPPRNRIWSRFDALDPPWVSDEGVKVSRIAICPSLFGHTGTTPTRIGILAHEIGHVMGLPDLYDNMPNGIGERVGHGIGSWGIMGNCWGFDQTQLHPPHFSPWCKIQLGWVTPNEIHATSKRQLEAIEQSPEVFKLTQGFQKGEYLLIENRQPLGFDQRIPVDKDGCGGLAIWHIDENQPENLNRAGFPGQTSWPTNGRHYRIAVLQADGKYSLEKGEDKGSGDDLYRGTLTSLITPGTVPGTMSYHGGVLSATPYSLLKISASGTIMNFEVQVVP